MASPLTEETAGDQKPESRSFPVLAGRALVAVITGLIRIYQRFISPLFPPVCRFYPSCSAYSMEAFRVHGFWRGACLTVRRLSRCHPWGQNGYDPVPNKYNSNPRKNDISK